jgi:ubiquinone/menaquinone biosynthesis C-methylase UbiE
MNGMSTYMETTQSYDDNAADWSERMKSKKNLAHEHLEKPAMYGKLGDLHGKSVLCVGCGTGEECFYLKELGAGRVVGIDVSKGMIEQAKFSYPEIEFDTQDVETMSFGTGEFDLVYSSLVLHYLRDWRRALSNIKKTLKDNGTVLFSVHHPVYWGATKSKDGTRRSRLVGFTADSKSASDFQIHGDYLNTRLIKDVWFVNMKVNYYHKSLEEIFREIRESGFIVTDFLEPKSQESSKKIKPDFYEIHQKIPLFAIFELKKS